MDLPSYRETNFTGTFNIIKFVSHCLISYVLASRIYLSKHCDARGNPIKSKCP